MQFQAFPIASSLCRYIVEQDGNPLLDFEVGSVNPITEIEFDLGIRSTGNLAVTADFSVFAGAVCDGAVTWTGYDSAAFVEAHAFNLLAQAAPPSTTYTEAQVPSGAVIGMVGYFAPEGTTSSNNCEVRVRRGSDVLMRARYLNWDDGPRVFNLGAGIRADSDTWVGIHSYSGSSCSVPLYWTTIDDGTFRPGRG